MTVIYEAASATEKASDLQVPLRQLGHKAGCSLGMQTLLFQCLVRDKHHHENARNDCNCPDGLFSCMPCTVSPVSGCGHSVRWMKRCYEGCCTLLQLCLHASCLLQRFACYTSMHLRHKEGIANLRTSSLCRSARVLLVLVMLDRGGGQGGHWEQGQLHLGHSMAVQQALCPGKVCLQASYPLLTAPQPSLNCSLQQT